MKKISKMSWTMLGLTLGLVAEIALLDGLSEPAAWASISIIALMGSVYWINDTNNNNN